MLQVQLEIDSRVFFEKYKTNRIDIIAQSVEQAIQIATTIDPDLDVIMPQYMCPIEHCTSYDYTNTDENKRLYVIGENMKAMPGWILNSRTVTQKGTMKYLCEVEIESLKPLNEAQKENLDDIGIYMLDEDKVESEMSEIDNA